MKRVELLAPAGSLNILKVAVDNGADAVYCGVNLYNARINADNFTLENLRDGCIYAHRRSTKVYLTLNTIINDDELSEATELASDAYNCGVDGILIQDLGLASMIHEKYPEIPLHASTQMNIYSSDDFNKLKELGISRVVLPREMTMKEISNRTRIASRNGIETEVFAHGAVCVCYSGLCLFSSMNKSGTRSGNRGLCAQPCRQEYKMTTGSDINNGGEVVKDGHLLSPKDRSIIPFLSDLISAGVSSLKIEGRMRDENYVASAVHAYRVLIDAYYDGTLDNDLVKSVSDSLLVNFNRGGSFTTQSLGGKQVSNMLSGEYVGKFGLKIGHVMNTDYKKGNIVVSFNGGAPLPTKGDYLSIRDRSKEICSFPVGKVHEAPGSITVKGLHPDMISKLNKNLPVYLMSHDFIGSRPSKRKTRINISFDSTEYGVLKINARVVDGMFAELFAETQLDYDTSFEGKPLDNERIEAQLRKTGDTPFSVDEVYFVSDVAVICPVSTINDLRRMLVDSLLAEIDYEASHNVSPVFDMFGEDDDDVDNELEDFKRGEISTLYYFPSFRNVKGDMRRDADIYAFSIHDLLVKNFRKRIVEFISSDDLKLAVVMPDLVHDEIGLRFKDCLFELKELLGEKFYAIIDSDNLSDSSIYEEIGVKHFLSAGANLYNSKSIKNAIESHDGAYVSYEMSIDEAMSALNTVNSGCVLLHAGGLIPWMQSDFCPIGNNKEKCHECFNNDVFILNQENGEKECRIVTRPFDHSSVIYGDPKVTYAYEEAEQLSMDGIDVVMCYTEII